MTGSPVYHHPNRPRPATWTAAMAWWHSLPDTERLKLWRVRHLRSCASIVDYWRHRFDGAK